MVKPLLVKAQKLVKGKALDLGAGEGFDSLFLACKGFQVTAVEISEDFCKEITLMEIQNIKVITQDIKDFKFEESYDLINCSFVLHFLKDSAKLVLKRIQENTAEKGVNVIIAFLNKGGFRNIDEGFFESGELKKLYHGWEEIVYSEKAVPTKERTPEGEVIKQLTAFAIFKRING